MLLTITTTRRPATDLGFLLHKHPERVQAFSLPFSRAAIVVQVWVAWAEAAATPGSAAAATPAAARVASIVRAIMRHTSVLGCIHREARDGGTGRGVGRMAENPDG